ncbi:hypothetical protein [Rhodohalobacter mucosus]|uniref:hypothetical protein n=1 Tax=Rhodohalobacter mucosus TaxID=2079485 RepID=UPI0018EEB769|nr:hypothetical protein [Rhodohalobacter mucosus]
MGQQQLLLVILVTIIVGIATVVAINTFGSAADAANIDAVRTDVAAIASGSQGYFMKPTMLGGGGRTFTNITFEDFGFAANGVTADGLTAQNENGRYVISARGVDSFLITAHPASDEDYVAGTVDADGVLSGGTDATESGEATVTANNVTVLAFGSGS